LFVFVLLSSPSNLWSYGFRMWDRVLSCRGSDLCMC
jgi:hypothetical protein